MGMYGCVGPDVDPVGAEDVLSKTEAAGVHYGKVGFGADLGKSYSRSISNTFASKIARKERSRQRAKTFFFVWCHVLWNFRSLGKDYMAIDGCLREAVRAWISILTSSFCNVDSLQILGSKASSAITTYWWCGGGYEIEAPGSTFIILTRRREFRPESVEQPEDACSRRHAMVHAIIKDTNGLP